MAGRAPLDWVPHLDDERACFSSPRHHKGPMTRRPLRSRDGLASGILIQDGLLQTNTPLLVCIHGGGCNANYFDIKGFSIVEAACERGLPVLLLNRPGYAGNPQIGGDKPLAAMAPVLRAFVDQVREEFLPQSGTILMIGHSIGAAVTVTMLSERGDWPVLGAAISGIGDAPAPGVIEWSSPDRVYAFPPPELAASLFFGPEGSFGWQGPTGLRRVSEPWVGEEVMDVVHGWPKRWPRLAAAIDVPIHLRIAEHEKIWETGQNVVERMAASLSRAPFIDAALLPEGGHLYEIHRRGPELIASQLDFFDAARSIWDGQGLHGNSQAPPTAQQ